ncbi:TPA_asm: tail fiber protein [Salmonella enterica subsp. houtenae serovar 45:g,z51:-]|uniref:Tail fiber protein n=1 Tax=Salmonella enterica subsp. houtenae serovar 45:g,z51:- TaxID=1967611 RepID=A0A736VCC5_SALHO|nr:tail fiber protein [Salmonella enterica subsp. houtenae str. CFSAN000557]HAE7767433.1 tail fiber protein [Salmonella enterica subsp. houtenae serovar 45:g,z51:-]
MPNTVMDEWSDMVFLKPNGASFSATEYPKLAKVWTGLVIPDMRGEFLRIWDDGRGVDAGRNLLSAQGDAIRNITASMGANGRFLDSLSATFSGAWAQTTRQSGNNGGTATVTYTGFDFDASRVVPTASENRPRNIALNFLVRAK